MEWKGAGIDGMIFYHSYPSPAKPENTTITYDIVNIQKAIAAEKATRLEAKRRAQAEERGEVYLSAAEKELLALTALQEKQTIEKGYIDPIIAAQIANKPVTLRTSTAKRLSQTFGPLILSIDTISATDLFNAGSFMDKQDPGLIIKLGKLYTYTTARVQDGGTSTVFPEKYDNITINYEDMKSGIEIEVEAHNMDKNNKSKKLLGIGKIKLIEAVPRNNERITFTIPLDIGTITMTGIITQKSMSTTIIEEGMNINDTNDNQNMKTPILEVEEKRDDDRPPYLLSLYNIHGENFENTSSYLDKQDPGLIIQIGNKHKFTTERVQDAGTEASFPEVYNDIKIAYSDIESNIELSVEVHNMDKSNNSKKLIGTGKIKLSEALPKYNERITFTIPLMEKGIIIMSGILKAPVLAMPEKSIDEQILETLKDDVSLDAPGSIISIENTLISDITDDNMASIFEHQLPTSFKLCLSGISGVDFENFGSYLDKQDPGLIIKIGNLYTFTTDRQCDAGTAATFPECFNDIDISYDDVQSGLDIQVEVHNFDKNLNSKKLIGKGIHYRYYHYNNHYHYFNHYHYHNYPIKIIRSDKDS